MTSDHISIMIYFKGMQDEICQFKYYNTRIVLKEILILDKSFDGSIQEIMISFQRTQEGFDSPNTTTQEVHLKKETYFGRSIISLVLKSTDHHLKLPTFRAVVVVRILVFIQTGLLFSVQGGFRFRVYIVLIQVL